MHIFIIFETLHQIIQDYINKDIYLVGINFDKEKKNISKFEWEKV